MRSTMVAVLALVLAGCSSGDVEAPDAAASGASAAAGSAPLGAGDPRESAAPEGLPAEAVALPNTQGRQLWGVRRPEGRALVYEATADGLLSATAGRLEDLPTIYPGVDFGALQEE